MPNTLFPKNAIFWLILIAFLSTSLTITKAVSIGIVRWRSLRINSKSRQKYSVSHVPGSCYFSISKQGDNSFVIQFIAFLIIQNRTNEPLNLINTRVRKPTIRGEIIHSSINIGDIDSGRSFAYAPVPPKDMRRAYIMVIIRARKFSKRFGKPRKVTLDLGDSNNNYQSVQLLFKNHSQLEDPKKFHPLEAPYKITNPLEKELASLLQSELHRYEKCGRNVGGLGSIRIVTENGVLTGVGHDFWRTNSPQNQSISNKNAIIESDHLDAFFALYNRLKSNDECKQFVALLIDRIDPKKGYLAVSYFIVFVLWKIGYLSEALRKVKITLPQNETKAFGLSNVLMLLNGLLNYCHSDFNDEMLDTIEEFVHGLSEHTFKIPEKITTIRALRLISAI